MFYCDETDHSLCISTCASVWGKPKIVGTDSAPQCCRNRCAEAPKVSSSIHIIHIIQAHATHGTHCKTDPNILHTSAYSTYRSKLSGHFRSSYFSVSLYYVCVCLSKSTLGYTNMITENHLIL